MGGKLNLYNLGSLGVNVDKSPIHEEDGELLSAQNAVPDAIGVMGGIRKRDGMLKLNAAALAGSILGSIGLPLPDRSTLTRTFYLPLNDNTNRWLISTTGASWATAGTPTRAAAEGALEGSLQSGNGFYAWQGFNDKLYYPGNDYTPGTTAPTLHSWDGTTDVIVATIPDNPNEIVRPVAVTSLQPYDATRMLVAVVDDGTGTGNGRSRVLLMNISTGQMTQLGPETDLSTGKIYGALIVWQGKIWITMHNGNGGIALRTYAIRPEDPTWTLDNSYGTAHGYGIDLAIFKGELYQGAGVDVGASAEIRKRTQAGVWSVVHTSDGTGAGNYVGPFAVKADGSKIFAYRNSVSGGAAPKLRIMESSDGAVWTTSYNISTNLSDSYTRSGRPFMDSNGDIYWPLASGSAASVGGLLKLTDAGVWSIVLSARTDVRGPLGIIRA